MIDNIKIEVISGSNISNKLVDSSYEVEKNSDGEYYEKNDYYEILKQPTNISFFSYSGDIITGVLSINTKSKKYGGCTYLVNISVDKNYQRKGVGTKLIKRSIEYISSNNSGEVMYALSVDKKNLRAISLYKKIGFKIDNNYSDDEDYCMFITIKTDK